MNQELQESELIDYGRDTILFRFRKGCLITVNDLLHRLGKYSPLETNKDRIYQFVPNDGRHHVVCLDISGNVCPITFHYTNPDGRIQVEDKLGKFRISLAEKLEVVE